MYQPSPGLSSVHVHQLQRAARGIQAIAYVLRQDNEALADEQGILGVHQREGLLMASESLACGIYGELTRLYRTEPDDSLSPTMDMEEAS